MKPPHLAQPPGTGGLLNHPAWQRLQPRERRLVLGAGALVLLALWWGVLVRPAWRQWSAAPQQLAALQAQHNTLQALAAQAKALKALPARSRDERLAALDAATRTHFGQGATLQGAADRYTVQLNGASPEALARWLADVRVNAQLTPEAVQLTRSGAHWQGPVRFNLAP